MPTTETPFQLAGKRVWVAGHRGMVGAAVLRRLASEDCEILTASHAELDLTRQQAVEDWMAAKKPQAIIMAAARVGGIHANESYPANFIYDNLTIETNIIHAAYRLGVEKLLFLGSSCIYPRLAPQPLHEDALLSGPLEPTNEWYAVAKIAGIKLCQAYRRQYGCDFIAAMPTNLYGPGDNYHPENSHAVAALIRKVHDAKQAGQDEVVMWGTGKPTREFLFVDDCADGLVFLLKSYSSENFVNLGTGLEHSILELAQTIAAVIGWRGRFVHDLSKPDGTPRKVMDSSRLKALGWSAKTCLAGGLANAYGWFLENRALEIKAGGK
ncbi:bifunctional GDP-fucose synthetase: GDP-4-dehydro-6-deoxy-D-mannose epimerase and GDP-4-dehydro-6-L-deoxygalactose reductase [Rhodospirillaceae bacterium LM-1]|nr:bifunctional GDP-fucose synthetase: GDP-4-dehydro-6-deoxy-D-mannose epimerase and GDP-4-dehydro-6-L-deoxygalactose reductase [Rhodospirillaceae bacterium LM-1]